jgi:hypothetical protein
MQKSKISLFWVMAEPEQDSYFKLTENRHGCGKLLWMIFVMINLTLCDIDIFIHKNQIGGTGTGLMV